MPDARNTNVAWSPTANHPPGLTDVDVVARVLGGESALFELIMRRYNRLLYRLARSILRSDADAEDVVQEAYLRAYTRLDQFKGPHGFRSWLCRIAINEALRRVRGAKPKFSLDDVDSDEAAVCWASESLRALPNTSTESGAMGAELIGFLEIAIDELPVAYRAVFMLRAVEQYDVAETAQCLGINPATVKTRFHRARRLLQNALDRHVEGAAREAFPFAGQRCDRIVSRVLAGLPSR